MGVNKIDGHRHNVMLEAIEVATKLDPVKSANIYPSGLHEKSEEVNRKKGVEWSRKMSDLEENVADLKAAGMDLGILQPTQTMKSALYFLKSAAKLLRTILLNRSRMLALNCVKTCLPMCLSSSEMRTLDRPTNQ